jgi:uncharacterized protein YbjQ (UPF0145 family)
LSDSVEAFLSNYPEEIRLISKELRGMARSAMPGAYEFLFYNAINYSLSASSVDRICYISPAQKHVTLGLLFGAQLNDPRHLLQGRGNRRRHVKVRTLEDARKPGLEDLLREAWATGADSVAQMKQQKRQMKRKKPRTRRPAVIHGRKRRTRRSRYRSRRR